MADLGLKNVANITYEYQPDPNISSVESGEIQSNTTNDTISSPDVYFEKKTCDTAVPKGGIADYTLLAVNQGTAALSQIVINDDLPILDTTYKVNYVEGSATATINGIPAVIAITEADPNRRIFTVNAPPEVSVAGTGVKIGPIEKEIVGYSIPFTANFVAGDTITIGGKTFTAGAEANQFAVGENTAAALNNLITLYNAGTNADPNYRIVPGTPTTTLVVIRTNKPAVTTTETSGTPLTEAVDASITGVIYKETLSDTDYDKLTSITIGNKTLTVVDQDPVVGTSFIIGGDASATATNIVNALNNNMPTGYTVTAAGAVLSIVEDPKPTIDIMPGDSVVIQFKGQVPEGSADYIPGPGKTMPAGADPLIGDVMTNTADLGFTYDNNGTITTVTPGDTAAGGKEATITSEIHQAEIWAAKTLGTLPDPVLTGSDLTYVFTLTNKGDREATNVTISDMLPDNFKMTSQTGAAVALTIGAAGEVTIEGAPTAVATAGTATINTLTNTFTLTGLTIPAATMDTYQDEVVTVTLKGKYKKYV